MRGPLRRAIENLLLLHHARQTWNSRHSREAPSRSSHISAGPADHALARISTGGLRIRPTSTPRRSTRRHGRGGNPLDGSTRIVQIGETSSRRRRPSAGTSRSNRRAPAGGSCGSRRASPTASAPSWRIASSPVSSPTIIAPNRTGVWRRTIRTSGSIGRSARRRCRRRRIVSCRDFGTRVASSPGVRSETSRR